MVKKEYVIYTFIGSVIISLTRKLQVSLELLKKDISSVTQL